MRIIILVLLGFQFFISQNCGSETERDNNYCWLNIKYIECLKDGLPCECEKLTETYYSLVVDTDTNSKHYGIVLSKYDFMEPHTYPIKKISSNEYLLLRNKKDTTNWARLVIKKDSIYFIEKDILSVFCKTNYSDKYNIQHYLLDNVDLLDKSLTKRGYPKLEDIVKYDSLNCECNKWKGNVNLLSVNEKAQSWILEIKNDSLFIDLVTYPSDDPDLDDPIIPKRFKVFKWE